MSHQQFSPPGDRSCGNAPHPAPAAGASVTQGESDRSFVVTWLLSWLLGSFGADRFYLGKIGTAIAKLLTGGGFGIWALIDVIMHLVGATRDKQGRALAGYDRHKKLAWIVTIGVWLLQLIFGSIIVIAVIATGGVRVNTTTTGPGTDPGASPQGDSSTGGTGNQAGLPGAPASDETVAWAESAFGTFDPVTVDGSGDQTVPMPGGASAALVTVESTTDFTDVTALNADGEGSGGLSLFVRAGESAQGAVGFSSYGFLLGDEPAHDADEADDDEVTTRIRVVADGDWSMTIAPISAAPAFPDAGADTRFYLYDGPGGTADIEYTGAANIIIQQYGDTRNNLVVNEVGAYSGTVELDPGPSLMRVIASGDWTLTPH